MTVINVKMIRKKERKKGLNLNSKKRGCFKIIIFGFWYQLLFIMYYFQFAITSIVPQRIAGTLSVN
jgi:hypothetical protein